MKSMFYHWFNEPDNVRIKINKTSSRLIINKLKDIGGPHKLSRKCGYSPAKICRYFKDMTSSVGFLKSILNILNIPLEEIEPFVTEISWLKSPNLPFNLDTTDASVLSAAILGDGSNTVRLMYKNTRNELIEKVENSAKRVFGNLSIDHRVSDDGIPYIFFPRIVGRVLTFNGIPYGNKIYQNKGVPQSIMESDVNVKKAFLQQFFDDEGGVESDYRKIFLSQSTDCTPLIPTNFYNRMKIKKAYYLRDMPSRLLKELVTPKILSDINIMMETTFDIASIIRFKRVIRYRTHATSFWEIEIGRKDDIRKFYEIINFHSYDKRRNLDFMVNRSYEMPWNIYEKIINESIQVSRKQGFFRPTDISKRLSLPFGPVNKRIRYLNKKGIFSRMENGYKVNIKAG